MRFEHKKLKKFTSKPRFAGEWKHIVKNSSTYYCNLGETKNFQKNTKIYLFFIFQYGFIFRSHFILTHNNNIEYGINQNI